MIRSHFEKIERPYPIISYGREVAMQIATLVEEEDVPNEQGGTDTVVHRRPVVSHECCMEDRLYPSDGVVWDQVELESVNTLFTEETEFIDWFDFEKLVGTRLYSSTIDEPKTDATYALSLYKRLCDLAIEVILPPTDGTYYIVLGKHRVSDGEDYICCGFSGEVEGFGDHEMQALGLNFPLWAKGDEEEMYKSIQTEMKSYMSIIGEDAQFNFGYAHEEFKGIAEKLNIWMGE